MVEIQCEVCGKAKMVKPHEVGRAKYCSPKCRGVGCGNRRVKPLADRFWAKVDVRGPMECWPWTASTAPGGYGAIGESGKYGRVLRADRLALLLTGTPVPDDAVVMHKCDNPPCCNPAHLRVGTRRDNSHDAVAKNRLVAGERHKGHKLTAEQVSEIRRRLAGGETMRRVAGEFGVTPAAIHKIKYRLTWRVVSP